MKPKRRIQLDQIKIASPCPISWTEMLGDDRVRFCTHCSKKVYNLSALTKYDAENLITKKNGELCALLYVRKDGSIMNTDCPVGLSELRRRIVRRVSGVAAAIFALVGLGLGGMYARYRESDERMTPALQQFGNGMETQLIRNEAGEEIVVTRTLGVVATRDSFVDPE
jgi:hypothetical protein